MKNKFQSIERKWFWKSKCLELLNYFPNEYNSCYVNDTLLTNWELLLSIDIITTVSENCVCLEDNWVYKKECFKLTLTDFNAKSCLKRFKTVPLYFKWFLSLYKKIRVD